MCNIEICVAMSLYDISCNFLHMYIFHLLVSFFIFTANQKASLKASFVELMLFFLEVMEASSGDMEGLIHTCIPCLFDQTLRLLFISLLILCGYYLRAAIIRG